MTTYTAHPLDLGIFIFFLSATLVVGLSYGRSFKTLRDYALGDRNFSTSALVATIIATWITGRFLTSRIDLIYHKGLQPIIEYLCDVGSLFIVGGVLASRMGPFLGRSSVAEAMGSIYGRPIRVITAVFSLLLSVGLVALQFRAGEGMLGMLFGWDATQTKIFIGAVVIVYSSLGGIRAVTFTDVVQFFTFGTLIPFLALVVWNSLQNLDEVVILFKTAPDFSISTLMGASGSSRRWGLLTALPLFLIPDFSPPIFQRVAMACNTRQVRRAFLYASALYLLLFLFVIWIAIVIRADNASLMTGQVFPYVVSRYLSEGGVGLLLAGLAAMIMSTVDSNLNAASVIFAEEVARVVFPGTRLQSSTSQRLEWYKLLVARCANVLLGCFALYLSLYPESYLSSKIVNQAWHLYMPIVSVPLLLAVWGFRSTTLPVLIGMVAGFVTVMTWDDLVPYDYLDSGLPSMLANLFGLLGSHYLLRVPGGWQASDTSGVLVVDQAARRWDWQRRWKLLRSFKLSTYLRRNLPEGESSYFFLGLYALVAIYVACYVVALPEYHDYRVIYTGVCYTVLPLATFFLTLPVWPPEFKKERFMAYLWPFGIGVLLFFASALLVLVSQGDSMQVMVLVSNLLMGVFLLHWLLLIFLMVAGIGLAVCFFTGYTGATLSLSVLFASFQWSTLHGLLLLISLIVVLLRGKYAYQRLSTSYGLLSVERGISDMELLEALHHRERLVRGAAVDKENAVMAIHQMHQDLDESLKRAKNRGQLLAASKAFRAITDKVNLLVDYLSQVTYQLQGHMQLEVRTFSLTQLLQDALAMVHTHDKNSIQYISLQQDASYSSVQGDIEKLKQLLIDGLRYAQRRKQEDASILLHIGESSLGYPINAIPGHVKRVRALCFSITTAKQVPALGTLYMVSVDRRAAYLPKDITELPIAHNQQITEAHYGAFEFMEDGPDVLQRYVIPVHLREVRPHAMDLLEPNEQVTDKTTQVDPAEEAFMRAVRDKTKADLPLVEKAIQLIKRYYAGTVDRTGEAFYLRPVAVARLLLNYTQDQDTLLAALLYDTLEHTKLSLMQIALYFNESVKKIIDGVIHLESNLSHYKGVQLSNHESILQLLEAKDERVLYVKLADRLHSMRTIEGYTSPEEQREIASETLRFFVPLAIGARLDLIAAELKEHCVAVLQRR